MGRPTKVEGNPDHPGSGTPEREAQDRVASTDIFAQAAILSLYDPDRSETINNRGAVRTYSNFLGEISTQLERQREKQGAGLRFLTETVTSPTLAAQLTDILRRYPGARWHQYEPLGANSAVAGARLAFGDAVSTIYRFAEADRVLSLDSDFLSCSPANLRHARDFATRRRVREGDAAREMNRLYAVETTATNTGMFADHRAAVRPSEMETFARAIAAGIGVGGAAGVSGLKPEHARFVETVAADLKEHGGRSIVIAGDEQPPMIHALAHAMNAALGNVGKTVLYTDPVAENATDQLEDLRTLLNEVDAGAVDMLIIIGGNPVFNAPADFDFGNRIRAKAGDRERVPLRVHLSLYEDETSELCHWHIPEAHFLEAWSDARAYDGTVSIIQPLIQPLYNGKSAHELLAAFTDRPDRAGYDIVREYWASPGAGQRAAQARPAATSATPSAQATPSATPAATPIPTGTPAPARTPAPAATPAAAPASSAAPSADFEKNWRKWVHDGVIPKGETFAAKNVSVRGDFAAAQGGAAAAGGAGQYEIVFRPDPSVYDGRFANNGWLQELPKPLTKLTWDNAAIISPATADRLGIGDKPDGAVEGGPVRVNPLSLKGGEILAEVVKLSFKGREVLAPIFILPGQPDGVVTVHLGYGRRRAGRVGGNAYEKHAVGFDAYQLRTSDALWHGADVKIEKTGDTYSLASSQIHFQLEGREIIKHGSFEQYRKDPTLAHEGKSGKPEGGGEKAHNEEPTGEGHAPESGETLYPAFPYDDLNYNSRGYKWGMAIDLTTCVGCNSCVIACQAENNIPVVGKEQVARSREMHWIRVDSYFRGAVENPSGVYFMPVPCMHCENAPCEPVCPVHATVHSAEGTNDMVYNRCIGTRYCSNNCPYKVRRFNFLLYQDWDTPSLKMMRNPEVSVRSRGVMEKCTYCIQRIEYAKIESEKEGRRVRDGEIITACQGACPTEAIVFGDLSDHNSKVSKMQAQKHRYDLLADLNTRPRTVYLASVRNPNPALGGEA
jgi:molybdopterin-containing oxidoreductase family iron-sulfur binding subunit